MHTEQSAHQEAVTSTYCVRLYQKGESADKRGASNYRGKYM